MAQKKTLTTIFLFSTAFAILSALWLLFNIIGNIELLLETSYQFVVTLMFLSILVSIACLRKLLIDIRSKINKIKEKEKNIKECYQYDQLLNPPIMNN
jgi:hypothetical protein